jgi:hypothetical protein
MRCSEPGESVAVLGSRSRAPAWDRISPKLRFAACQNAPSRKPSSHMPTESSYDMLGGSPVWLGEAELRG